MNQSTRVTSTESSVPCTLSVISKVHENTHENTLYELWYNALYHTIEHTGAQESAALQRCVMSGHACAVAGNGNSTAAPSTSAATISEQGPLFIASAVSSLRTGPEASSADPPLAGGSGVTAADVQHDMGRHAAEGVHVLKRGEITQTPRAVRTHRELQQDVKKTGRAIMHCSLEMCGMLNDCVQLACQG